MWEIFPSNKELAAIAFVIAALGYGACRGIEVGCGYVSDRFEVVDRDRGEP